MRRRDRLLVIVLALLLPAAAYAQSMGLGAGVPDAAPVYPRGSATSPGLDFIFSTNAGTVLWYENGVSACVSAATCLTTTRATTNGSATDLLPTSASGQTITTFADNTARISSVAGGLIVEEARVNQLLNATVPVTQTTASINCASPGCTLWVNGGGSATASAGTATGCSGFTAATNGSPNTFICTGAGTIVVTVSGSLNAFQLEIGGFGTSLCISGGSACSRSLDLIMVTTVPVFSTSYSLFSSGRPEEPLAGVANQVAIQISDGTANNRVSLRRDVTAGAAQTGMISGGGAITVPTGTTIWAQNTTLKLAAAFVANLQNLSANAVLDTPTTTATILSGALITRIDVGQREIAGSQFNGVLSRITLWPTVALTGVQLQAITR